FGFWDTSADRIARALYNVDDACVPAIILTIVLKSTARSFGHLYGADGSSLGGPVGTARPRPINPNRSFRIDQTLSNRCAWFRCHGLDLAMGDCGVHLAAACPGESGPVASTRCSLDLGEHYPGQHHHGGDITNRGDWYTEFCHAGSRRRRDHRATRPGGGTVVGSFQPSGQSQYRCRRQPAPSAPRTGDSRWVATRCPGTRNFQHAGGHPGGLRDGVPRIGSAATPRSL